MVLDKEAEAYKQESLENSKREKSTTFPESAGGRGKIRYLGGWCVRSIKKVKKRNRLKNLYKPSKKQETANLREQLELLQQLEATEHNLLESSIDKDSLTETIRRQNVRKGLTNICDSCFNFFLLLDKKIRILETSANLDLYGSNFMISPKHSWKVTMTYSKHLTSSFQFLLTRM